METKPKPTAPRPVLGLVALAGAALVAVLAWKAWEVTREADALARPPAAPATPLVLAPPPAAAPPAPEVPYGEIVTARAPIPAPPVELPTADGKRFSIAAARGQVVLVNFWATWCPPCAKEMPSMLKLGEALAKKHPGKFKMVAVSVDESADQVKAFFAKPPFGGLPRAVTVALEPGAGEVTRSYYCKGRGACGSDEVKFPESYIVDREGRIVAFVVGDMDWSIPSAAQYLEALIAG